MVGYFTAHGLGHGMAMCISHEPSAPDNPSIISALTCGIILLQFGLITFRFAYMRILIPPHFHDFGIFGGVPEPQNQYYLFLERPGYLNKSKKYLK